MIIATAEGDRTAKVSGTPLRHGSIGRDNCPIITIRGRVLDHIARTFVELPMSDYPSCGLVLCRAGSDDCRRYDEKKHPKDEAAKSFAHGALDISSIARSTHSRNLLPNAR